MGNVRQVGELLLHQSADDLQLHGQLVGDAPPHPIRPYRGQPSGSGAARAGSGEQAFEHGHRWSGRPAEQRRERRVGDGELAASRGAEHTEEKSAAGPASPARRPRPSTPRRPPRPVGWSGRQVGEQAGDFGEVQRSGAVERGRIPSSEPGRVRAMASTSARSACAVQDTGPSWGAAARLSRARPADRPRTCSRRSRGAVT